MPFPIMKVNEQTAEPQYNTQDLLNMIPVLMQPFFSFSKASDQEKEIIKKIWLTSSKLEDDRLKIEGIPQQELHQLAMKGFIKGDGNIIEFTQTGKKILRESILNDEKSSFTKKASKQLMAKNSYDFGDEVLVKVKDAEKFGARYINISKKVFAKKKLLPQVIESYNILTKTENGQYKNIKDYSDEELIQVLHLAKKIIKNSHEIIVASSFKNIPINRLKSFAEIIMTELNSRS